MAAAKSDQCGEGEVHEIKGMTELYNPECRLVNSLTEDSDQYPEATDLDRKRESLLKTYLNFNRKLWTGAINNHKLAETEDNIGKKLKEFQDGVKHYFEKNKSVKHCPLYNEFEINGVAREVKRKKNKKKNKIASAFSNFIEFPKCDVSFKTQNGEENEDKQPSEVTVSMSWEEATQGYLDRYYPTDGVFRIPPSLEYDDEMKVKNKRLIDLLFHPEEDGLRKHIAQKTTGNIEETMDDIRTKRRGRKAESEIFNAFEKWGRDTGQAMFIFGGYKYEKYLENVTNEFKSLTSEQGEYDLLIISQQLGIISVETKGTVGAEYVMKESLKEKTSREGGGDVDAAGMKTTNFDEDNVVTSEGPTDSVLHQTKGVEEYNPNSTSNIHLTEMNTRSGLCTDSSSCVRLIGDVVIPNDTSLLEWSGIKGIGKYKTTTYRRIQSEIQLAWCQIMKGNFVFREMNRDLSFVRRLPFKAFVGLPFLSRWDLNKAYVCSYHQRNLICSEDLDELQDWLRSNHFPEGYGQQAMPREEFRELAARFAGLASAAIQEVDRIKFTNRKMMCNFLTPQQNAIVHNKKKHAILFGDYGTGKTLVLTRKATSLVSLFCQDQQNPWVHITPCADLSNFKSCYGVTFSDQEKGCKKFAKCETRNIKIYQSFRDFYVRSTGLSPDRNVEVDIDMVIDAVKGCLLNCGETRTSSQKKINITDGNINAERVGEINSRSLVHDAPHDFRGRVPPAVDEDVQPDEKAVHHFFFDEFPVHPLQNGALEKLRNFFSANLKDSFLWISVATHSLVVSSQDNPSELLLKKLSIEVDEDLLFCYLKDVMRISGEMYKMIKQIETFIDKGHFEHSNKGHMLKGIKPKLYRIPVRKCEVLENSALDCECQVKYLASTLRRVLDTAVDKGGTPLSVTIMIYYVMSTPMFRRLRVLLTSVAQLLDIELVWNTMQSRYKEENFTTFADGLNRESDLLWKGADTSEASEKRSDDGRQINQNVQGLRSPCPAKETLEVKKLIEKWKIPVVDQRTFAGCETPVLIFIDPFGMRHWFKRGKGKGSGYHSLIFTRCTGHFILITWPDHEAEKMWHQHLNEYEAEIKESDATEEYKQGRYKYINSGREATESYLQMLLNKDLIEMNYQ